MDSELNRKPEWLKKSLRTDKEFGKINSMLNSVDLVTVCAEAKCPNLSECWSAGTATFMVLGDTCTRGCRFCAVKTGAVGQTVDLNEPRKIAEAVKKWKLKYVVITSVDRDDLPDLGANHFANCIKAVKEKNPNVLVEVLIPDFQERTDCLQTIIDAKPDVIAHNLEVVKELQKETRDARASYKQSLNVLKNVKKLGKGIYSKSALMLGLGETIKQVEQAMDDMRAVDVDFLTIGQYLQPTKKNIEVKEYVHPDVFKEFEKKAKEKGFLYCASDPLVRSSYKAGELFIESIIKKGAVNE